VNNLIDAFKLLETTTIDGLYIDSLFFEKWKKYFVKVIRCVTDQAQFYLV
jgi:hypothetical protein